VKGDHAGVGDRGWICGIVSVVPDVASIGARPAAGGNGGVVDGLKRKTKGQRNRLMVMNQVEIDISEIAGLRISALHEHGVDSFGGWIDIEHHAAVALKADGVHAGL